MRKVIICFVIAISFVCVSRVFAVNFQIDKAKVRIRMPAGWSDGGVVNVENKGKEPVTIRVYAGDWVYVDSDGTKNFFPAGTLDNSCAKWIKFYPTDFSIPVKGSQKVNYVVEIPPGTSGAHFGVLFFEVNLVRVWDESKGMMVDVYNRIASLFYIEPDGTIKREGRLGDLKISKSEKNFEVEILFENIGNIDIAAKGSLDFIDERGFVFLRGKFNDVYTLPNDRAKLYTTFPVSSLSSGKYDLILTVDLESDILVKEYRTDIPKSGTKIKITEIE